MGMVTGAPPRALMISAFSAFTLIRKPFTSSTEVDGFPGGDQARAVTIEIHDLGIIVFLGSELLIEGVQALGGLVAAGKPQR